MAKPTTKVRKLKRIEKTKHSDAVPRTANVPVPDRLQKKIARRVQFLERVAATGNSTLKTSKGGVAKRKCSVAGGTLGDLSSLSGALDDVLKQQGFGGGGAAAAVAGGAGKKPRPGGNGGGGSKKGVNGDNRLGAGACKTRGKIMRQETSRLQLVLHHPSYQQDPFAAVAAHLQATMPDPVLPPRAPLKPEEVRAKRRDKKKRQRQRARDGVVSMAS